LSAASGIIVPLVTPFGREGDVEFGALGKLVDYAIAEGADALMPTALSGEGPLLSEDETFRVWEAVFEANGGRRPVLPAVLPLVEMLDRSSNPTGTIKAGVRLRGIDVGVLRSPGQDLLPQEILELEGVLSEYP
jgi:dihydrodipicolinate synthase/N-acetylneuraminate lyase